MKVLYERGVAYLNMDYAVDYTYVPAVGISPLLQDYMYNASKQVLTPIYFPRYWNLSWGACCTQVHSIHDDIR